MQRRPSDVTLPPDPGQPATDQAGADVPLDPGSVPVEPAVGEQVGQAQQQPQGSPGQQPGVPVSMAGVPVVLGTPGMPGAPGMPYFPGGPPAPFGQPLAQQAPGQNLSPFQPQVVPSVPIAPGSLPGQPAAGTNPALELIRNMLTTPNPRGLAAIQVATGNQQSTGVAGIAGVASKREAEGIMVYNDKTKYNEWEFLYDARLEQAAMAQAQGAAQQVQGVSQPDTGGSGVFPGDGSNQRPGRGGGQGPGMGFGRGGAGGGGGRGGGLTPFPMPGGFGNFPPGGAPQPQAPRR
jgi:hypothetical protein